MSLLRPAWDSEDIISAVNAVIELQDETELVRAAKEAFWQKVREAAVENLTDITKSMQIFLL